MLFSLLFKTFCFFLIFQIPHICKEMEPKLKPKALKPLSLDHPGVGLCGRQPGLRQAQAPRQLRQDPGRPGLLRLSLWGLLGGGSPPLHPHSSPLFRPCLSPGPQAPTPNSLPGRTLGGFPAYRSLEPGGLNSHTLAEALGEGGPSHGIFPSGDCRVENAMCSVPELRAGGMTSPRLVASFP